ncbi:MAG: AAA family ATPase [Ilumatobacteraceae bacterium]
MRGGTVLRQALLSRLDNSRAPIVSIVAPSGYGKSTFLEQWALTLEEPTQWLSIEPADNDAVRFLGRLASAIESATGRRSIRALVSPTLPAVTTTTMRLVPALVATAPFVIVLDHLERLDDPASLDVVAAFVANLPLGGRLVLASRTEPPVPLGRLRTQRQIVEITADDLAMDVDDARQLLAAEDVVLSEHDLASLVERTEGWPVGLYLAALARTTRGPRVTPDMAFRGDDRLLADYVRAEVLAGLPPETTAFLVRTSILEQMTGPLCDAVTGRVGSQAVLEGLERRNLLLVPLDRNRTRYRYHHLFRELLHGELLRANPADVTELHSRAATWFEAEGHPELALGHAQSAGDADRVARLSASLVQPTYAAGRIATVRRWIEWFDERDLLVRYPQVAVNGSHMEATSGHPAAAERLAAIAEQGEANVRMPDGSPLAAHVAVNRAFLCADGVARMRADARLAQRLLAPGSPLLAMALALDGVAAYLDGDERSADDLWIRAGDVAVDTGAHVASAVVTAMRALVALEDDGGHADELSAAAVGIVEFRRVHEYGQAAIAFAVSARVAARRGDVPTARRQLARAGQLRPLLTYAVPWTAIYLLQIASAYIELADQAGAAAVLRDVQQILRLRPDLGVIADSTAALQKRVDDLRHGAAGASSITAAELRVVPFLATHLTLREIGERLHVSRHTVKTQTTAVYRKLGVASRSEAIDRIREIGLLGGGTPAGV